MDISLETLHVESEIARARILPSQLDTDANEFAPEKQKYSRPTWQVGARKSGVESWLQYFTELLEEPLLMVRGSDERFRCQYHSWTYGLDGVRIRAREIEEVEGFRPEDFCSAGGRHRGMVQP